MKSTELRIGNFVKVENDYEIIQGLHGHEALCALDIKLFDTFGVWQNYKDIQSIQLTEKWLIKFGFKKWGSYTNLWKRYSTTNCTVRSDASAISRNNCYFILNEDYRVDIEFVHQLQNLYYALTGDELVLAV